jgi:hypothetical protein
MRHPSEAATTAPREGDRACGVPSLPLALAATGPAPSVLLLLGFLAWLAPVTTVRRRWRPGASRRRPARSSSTPSRSP